MRGEGSILQAARRVMPGSGHCGPWHAPSGQSRLLAVIASLASSTDPARVRLGPWHKRAIAGDPQSGV